jgi:hypothetical protein
MQFITSLCFMFDSIYIDIFDICTKPIAVVARSKTPVCGRSLGGIVGSNPTGRHGLLSLVSVVCCQVEASATGRSLVQRSPTRRV